MKAQGELTADAVWDGPVTLEGDVVVPEGRSLTLLPGAELSFAPVPRWSCSVFRSAPEGYPIEASRRSRCDLIVLGILEARGTAQKPVRFRGGVWGGITVLGRGRASLSHASLEGAEDHLLQSFDDGRIELSEVSLSKARIGALGWGLSKIVCDGGRLSALETGFLCREGSRLEARRTEFSGLSEGVWSQQWALARAEGCRFERCGNFGAGAYDRSRLAVRDCSFASCERDFVEETH